MSLNRISASNPTTITDYAVDIRVHNAFLLGGLDVDNNVIINGNLSVGGSADIGTINGYTFPAVATTPGYILENADGLGTLAWVAGSVAPVIPYGHYVPVMSANAATVQPVGDYFIWTVIGNVMTMSGKFYITTRADSANTFEVTFAIPAAYVASGAASNLTSSGAESGLKGVVAFECVSNSSSTMTISYARADGSPFFSTDAIEIMLAGSFTVAPAP